MMNCMVSITDTLSIRADHVASIRQNAFSKTEITLTDGVVWSASTSVAEVTKRVNDALDGARATLQQGGGKPS